MERKRRVFAATVVLFLLHFSGAAHSDNRSIWQSNLASRLELDNAGSFMASLYYRECILNQMREACFALTADKGKTHRVNDWARANAFEKLGELSEASKDYCAAIERYSSAVRLKKSPQLGMRLKGLLQREGFKCSESARDGTRSEDRLNFFEESVAQGRWRTFVLGAKLPPAEPIKLKLPPAIVVDANSVPIEDNFSTLTIAALSAQTAVQETIPKNEADEVTRSIVGPGTCSPLSGATDSDCRPITTGSLPSFAAPRLLASLKKPDVEQQSLEMSALLIAISATLALVLAGAMQLVRVHTKPGAQWRMRSLPLEGPLRSSSYSRVSEARDRHAQVVATPAAQPLVIGGIEVASLPTRDDDEHPKISILREQIAEILDPERVASSDDITANSTSTGITSGQNNAWALHCSPYRQLWAKRLSAIKENKLSIFALDGTGNLLSKLETLETEQSFADQRRVVIAARSNEARGLLNPFIRAKDLQDPLRDQQLFGVHFDRQTWIFEALFGPSFVCNHRHALYHFSRLLDDLPFASLQSWHDLIASENVQKLPDYARLSSHSDTQKFFAQAMESEDFRHLAAHLEEMLSSLLSDADFRALTIPADGVPALHRYIERGAILVLPPDLSAIGSLKYRALARMFVSIATSIDRCDKAQTKPLPNVQIIAYDAEQLIGATRSEIEAFVGGHCAHVQLLFEDHRDL